MKSPKITFGGKTVSLLTWTQDMACWSFSLPAGKEGACPLSVYGEKSICGGCYAQINRYNMPNVLTSQWTRLLWLKHHLKTDVGRKYIIRTLCESISKHIGSADYFRGHDSGDFFSPEYIRVWIEVCRALPDIRFWFPTRAYWAKSDNWQKPLTELAMLPNVTIRASALKYNQVAPWYVDTPGSTVVTDRRILNLYQLEGTKLCPKTSNGGTCESNNCRECWQSDKAVAYLVHGYNGGSKAPIVTEKIKRKREEMALLTVNGVAVLERKLASG